MHHIIPRNFGGEDNPENLILLCNDCHNEVELMTDNLLQEKMYDVDVLRSFIINGFSDEYGGNNFTPTGVVKLTLPDKIE